MYACLTAVWKGRKVVSDRPSAKERNISTRSTKHNRYWFGSGRISVVLSENTTPKIYEELKNGFEISCIGFKQKQLKVEKSALLYMLK